MNAACIIGAFAGSQGTPHGNGLRQGPILLSQTHSLSTSVYAEDNMLAKFGDIAQMLRKKARQSIHAEINGEGCRVEKLQYMCRARHR